MHSRGGHRTLHGYGTPIQPETGGDRPAEGVLGACSGLCYRKGEDGQPEIVPEEAEIIKTIFNKFVDEINKIYDGKYKTS
mgnify:CR=1 FL=1